MVDMNAAGYISMMEEIREVKGALCNGRELKGVK